TGFWGKDTRPWLLGEDIRSEPQLLGEDTRPQLLYKSKKLLLDNDI
ncbi:3333_t:CDS:1, partial [Gigaspora margarita]